MLHFEINLDEYFKNNELIKDLALIPVIYANKRQKWEIGNYYSDRQKHVHDLIRYKSEAWSYEFEIRLLTARQHGYFTIPDSWLKSIVIGLNTDIELRDRLVSAGKNMDVPVYFAEMNSSEFRVDIPEFQIDGKSGENHYHEIIESKLLDIPSNK